MNRDRRAILQLSLQPAKRRGAGRDGPRENKAPRIPLRRFDKAEFRRYKGFPRHGVPAENPNLGAVSSKRLSELTELAKV
jgi:hypothetical protein